MTINIIFFIRISSIVKKRGFQDLDSFSKNDSRQSKTTRSSQMILLFDLTD
jgi:hypothetical protein